MKKKKRDYKKWARKWMKPGSVQIPPDKISGIGEGKPNICDICKREVVKTISEVIDNKLITRCVKCKSDNKVGVE